MNKKFREEVVEYLVQCQNQKPFGKWALDSTGTAMPLDMAEFGAKYMLDKVCAWLDKADEHGDAFIKLKEDLQNAIGI
jgi:hypothetical protein